MITVRLTGGMGNQMFQYSFGKHLAIKNNTSLRLDLSFLNDRTPRKNVIFRNYDLDIFTLTPEPRVTELQKYKQAPSKLGKLIYLVKQKFNPNYVREKHFNFDPKALSNPDGCYIDGQWTTEKYFIDVEKEIKIDFKFKAAILQSSLELSDKIKSTESICLNVRRADFVSNPITRKFHGVLEADYFNQAIKIMTEKVQNPHVFIFSDDIDWCNENIESDIPHDFVGPLHAGPKYSNYLQLMTFCKHFIIPNSTFGWWAAWLSENKDKVVIAPKNWFADKSVDTSDVIPKSWIKI